jgi:hypothetical protein
MPELKKFPVFGDRGRIGTLSAPARFLDNRAEKIIQLDDGSEISVRSEALEVQPDGSFYFREAPAPSEPRPESRPEPPPEPTPAAPPAPPAAEQLFRDDYSIERVKIGKFIPEPVSQRQEGDTLVLPVVEEVLVTEKRLMLREEIRITRRRETVV